MLFNVNIISKPVWSECRSTGLIVVVEYYDYDEAVVVTNQTFTRQAHALAMRNGVILWMVKTQSDASFSQSTCIILSFSSPKNATSI